MLTGFSFVRVLTPLFTTKRTAGVTVWFQNKVSILAKASMCLYQLDCFKSTQIPMADTGMVPRRQLINPGSLPSVLVNVHFDTTRRDDKRPRLYKSLQYLHILAHCLCTTLYANKQEIHIPRGTVSHLRLGAERTSRLAVIYHFH